VIYLLFLLALANVFAGPFGGPPVVTASKVQFKKTSDHITTLANISANNSAIIRSDVAGFVDKLVAKPGQKILQGQVILELRHRSESSLLEQAIAKKNYYQWLLEKKKKLYKKNMISDLELEDVKQNFIISKTEVEVARVNLDKKIIKAPFDGRLGIIRVKVGNYITPDVELVKLEDSATIWVDFFVPQAQAQLLKSQAMIAVSSDVVAKDMTAQIQAIDPFLNQHRQLGVRAKLVSSAENILTGSFARVTIPVGEKSMKAIIPETAVQIKNKRQVVFVVNAKGVVDERVIKVGNILAGGLLEVEGDLSVNDKVVILGGFKLQSGQKVIVATQDK
jgi:membrane fusion protein (multidrug efflux system)